MFPRTLVRAASAVVGASAFLCIGVSNQAQAATITVPAGDEAALVAAINSANGSGGADTLQVSGTYASASVDNWWYGPNQYPPITSDITIVGAAGTVLQATNGTRLRHFFVSGGRSGLSAGTLRLRDLELRGGIARGGSTAFGGAGAGLGGSIFSQGTLDLEGVTFTGNEAIGGTAGTVSSNGGGGLGADGTASGGGGFGGALPGSPGGAGGAGSPGGASGGAGGGGGGYESSANGAAGATPGRGAGGGTPNGLGGHSHSGTRGGAGSGAGGEPSGGATDPGAAGGRFGAGGYSTAPPGGSNAGGGGGGGVGGGGGGSAPGFAGGSGGFGGGGGWANYRSGHGGFGGGAGGADGRAGGNVSVKGGFGGGDSNLTGGVIAMGGGGAGMGGAIFNHDGAVTATNTTFTQNSATGGQSTAVFVGGTATASEGGDGLGAAIFNLSGDITLTHVTAVGNTTTGGAGSATGRAEGELFTLAYDSTGVAAQAGTTLRNVVTGSRTVEAPATLIDGAANSTGLNSAFVGTLVTGTPQLGALGNYGGPTRTLAPVAGSPVIDPASTTGSTPLDQRGLTRSAPNDTGAVEFVPTTVAVTTNPTLAFSGSAQSITVGATVSPARGVTSPGSVTFTLTGIGGSVVPTIAAGNASGVFSVPGGTAPGTYTINATAAAAPGFAAGTATTTGTLTILKPPPVCSAISRTTAHNTATTFATDCTGDVPADPVTIVDQPSNGTASVVAGDLRYAPTAGYSGPDSFTYTVTNNGGAATKATVSITVLKAPPVCSAISRTTANSTPVTIATDCTGDVPADPVTIVDAPSNGTASVVAGDLRYVPTAGYSGPDSFTYTVTNNGGAATKATVSITVLKAPPVCSAISRTTANSTPVTIATDCTGDVPADPVTIVDQPTNGTASIVSGDLRYAPTAGYSGPDSFTYTVTNNGGPATKATVSITVLKAPPVCSAIAVGTPFETAVTVPTDCTGDVPADPVTIVDAAAHGTAGVVAGDLRYTPAAGYAGPDSFTYTVTNNGGAATKATVSVTVAPAKPLCAPVSAIAGSGKATAITITCTSTVGQTHAIVGGPAHGALSGLDAAAGTVSYTSTEGYTGADSFTFQSTSTSGSSTTETVTLDVKAAPTITVTAAPAAAAAGTELGVTASVARPIAPGAAARVDFRLYGPGDDSCAGTPVRETAAAYPQAGGPVSGGGYVPTKPGVYRWRATYSGDARNVGVVSGCQGARVVVVAAPDATPVTPVAEEPTKVLSGAASPPPAVPRQFCGDTVVLLDVAPVGRKAKVSGLAKPSLAGETVDVLRGGKSVGQATVAANGRFSATVAGPKRARGTASYQVKIGSVRSRALSYDRSIRVVARGKQATGRLNVAARLRPRSVQVQRIDACTKTRQTKRVAVDRAGRFTFALEGPRPSESYALYRVVARISDSSRAFSSQLAVTK